MDGLQCPPVEIGLNRRVHTIGFTLPGAPDATARADERIAPMVTLDDVRAAAERIRDWVEPSPLIRSHYLSDRFDADIWLKLENLQRTGSFKPRGAANKLARLVETDGNGALAGGVVAASAGNHAQGVALAAVKLGASARVVMPRGASLSKQFATRGYGAEVELCGETVEEALGRAHELAAGGSVFVHPFDDPDVVAGQGTVGLEICEALAAHGMTPDEVWVPVGGGGLAAGVAVALKSLHPAARLVGVEAAGCAAATAALETGEPVTVEPGETMADGIRVAKLGAVPFSILKDRMDAVERVEEAAIPLAVLEFMERKKVLAEGAGALPLAALHGVFDRDPGSVRGKRIVLLVSGGNVDMALLDRLLEKALLASGRVARVAVDLDDAPGSLAALFALLADNGANVLDVFHDRDVPDLPVGRARVRVKIETLGENHTRQIVAVLRHANYTIQGRPQG